MRTSPLARLLCSLALVAPLGAQERSAARERVATELAPAVERPLPPGTALRLHAAGAVTSADRLAAALRALPSAGDPAGALEELTGLRRRVTSTGEGLLAAIRERIQPPLADGQRVELAEEGTLALLGDARQQAWLEAFLLRAASFRGLLDLQARIVVAREGVLPRRLVEHGGLVLTPEEHRVVLRELEGVETEVVVAPRVVAFPFQESTLAALEEIAYVQDYEVRSIPGVDVRIADPVIGTARDGVRMQLRGVPLGGQRLGIHTTLEYSSVAQPIPTYELHLGLLDTKATVQLPEITRVIVGGDYELDSGQTLLLASRHPSGGREVVLLLQSSLVPEAGAGGGR